MYLFINQIIYVCIYYLFIYLSCLGAVKLLTKKIDQAVTSYSEIFSVIDSDVLLDALKDETDPRNIQVTKINK
jgi:hypothetical protein